MKKEKLEKLFEKEIGRAQAKCLSTKKIGCEEYTEWVLIDKTTKNVVALFLMCERMIYNVKYIEAHMITELAKIQQTLYELQNSGEF